jgi:outer membrane lipoprotein SlyB
MPGLAVVLMTEDTDVMGRLRSLLGRWPMGVCGVLTTSVGAFGGAVLIGLLLGRHWGSILASAVGVVAGIVLSELLRLAYRHRPNRPAT